MKITVIRIEGPDGKGPWASDSLVHLEPIWDELGERIPLPRADFEGTKGLWNFQVVEELRRMLGGHGIFAFPSLEAFERVVGDHKLSVLPYIKVYETEEYILSKSGLQVIFTKGVYKSNYVT